MFFYDNGILESVMFDSILIVLLVVIGVGIMIFLVVDIVVEFGYMIDLSGIFVMVIFGFGYDVNIIGMWM